jgi:hypothetical protein
MLSLLCFITVRKDFYVSYQMNKKAGYKYEVSEEGNHIFGKVTHFGLISTFPLYKLMFNCFSRAESCDWECWNTFYNLEDKLGLHAVDSDKMCSLINLYGRVLYVSYYGFWLHFSIVTINCCTLAQPFHLASSMIQTLLQKDILFGSEASNEHSQRKHVMGLQLATKEACHFSCHCWNFCVFI